MTHSPWDVHPFIAVLSCPPYYLGAVIWLIWLQCSLCPSTFVLRHLACPLKIDKKSLCALNPFRGSWSNLKETLQNKDYSPQIIQQLMQSTATVWGIQMCCFAPSCSALIKSHNVGTGPLFRLCHRHDSWISAYQKWSPTQAQTHAHTTVRHFRPLTPTDTCTSSSPGLQS